MPTPCISVIVPVYNTEKYIYKCINSILNQTFSDIELILVDDGSTDSCGKICDEYAEKDSRVRAFHQENRGVCSARNLGIDNARGEYITFVDSDDYLVKYALELLYYDIVLYKADISCAGGGKVCSSMIEALSNSDCKIWRDREALRNSLLGNGHTHSACRKLYRKEFVGTTRFEDGRKIHEDSFFVFCCFLNKPTIVLRNVSIYHYTNNPNSSSRSDFSDMFFDVLYFAEKKKELASELFPGLEAEINNMVVRANIVMLQLFCRTSYRKYKKDIKQCIRTVKKLKKYYIPLMLSEKNFFLVVINNLYGVFRIYYKLKRKKK